jgi:hypothetical protein
MLPSLRKQLDQLTPLGAELNTAADAFAKTLKTVEAELATMNLGLEVEYGRPILETEVKEEQDEQGAVVRKVKRLVFLGYGTNAGSGWGLQARHYRMVFLPDDKMEYVQERVRTLLNSPRAIRLAAAEHLSGLLQAIHEEAAKKLNALKRVTDE